MFLPFPTGNKKRRKEPGCNHEINKIRREPWYFWLHFPQRKMLKEVWGLETLPTRRRCACLERSGGASGTWSLYLLNQSSGKAEGPSSLPLLSYPNQTPSGITETIPFLPSIFSFPRTSVLSCLPSRCYTRVAFLLSYWLHDSTHSWLLSFCVATETQRSWITSLRLQTSHLEVLHTHFYNLL